MKEIVPPEVPQDGPQYIIFLCDACGKKFRLQASHYDKFRCMCGKAYWALRPKRYGPLLAYAWPGTPAMLRFKQQGMKL